MKHVLLALATLVAVAAALIGTAEKANAQGPLQRITIVENIGNGPGGLYTVPAGKTLTITHLGTNNPNSTDNSIMWILYAGGGSAHMDTVANPGMVQLPTPRVFNAGDHVYLLGGGGGNYDCVAKGVLQ